MAPFRPRNELGWIIPRDGTKKSKIYNLLCCRKTPLEIAIELDMDPTTVRVHIHAIKHPALKNKYARESRHS